VVGTGVSTGRTSTSCRVPRTDKVLALVLKRLSLLTKDAGAYKKLLHALIVQGLIKLQEQKVQIVCRAQDVPLVKEVLPLAVQEYSAKSGKSVDAQINQSDPLPPGPETSSSEEGDFCSGGVVLSTIDGRIICANTLDARLSMVFDQKLPEIRTILFGESTTRKHRD